MTPEERRAIFKEGWNAALEEAAKVCIKQVERDAEYGGRFGGYGRFYGDKTGIECANDILALRELEKT